jgi:phosphoribosylformimino-5-aminoimidazole carboxamide ribotide isomerase
MRVIPVIDLMAGRVVRGIAGRRETYRPIESRLAESSDPLDVALAFRERLGLSTVYLADLDAISGAEPAWRTYAALAELGMHLWVDAGIRDMQRADRLQVAGVDTVVAGLETVPGGHMLAGLVEILGAERLVFSLDLKAGEPLGDSAAWEKADARGIAARVLDVGVRRMIVLDLARVGMGDGLGTEILCGWLRRRDPALELVAGGGVRHFDDLTRLAEAGIDAVLVASALHDGRIGRGEIEALGTPG